MFSFHSSFQSVAEVDLAPLASLEYLDLSRNLIAEIMPGTFMGMAQLKGLDFSVNVVRKVSQDVRKIPDISIKPSLSLRQGGGRCV